MRRLGRRLHAWSSATVAFGSVPLSGDAAIDEDGEVTPELCEDDDPSTSARSVELPCPPGWNRRRGSRR